MKFYFKILFLLISFASFQSFGQLNTYSVNELDSLLNEEQRPIVFFIKTDWCSICHGMENVVLKDEEVTNVLNESFYLVIFNAESKEDVVFKGRRYVFEPSGIRQGKHQFAMELAGGQGTIAFPSTIIVSSEGKLYQSNSFINKDDMLYILKTIREALLE